MRINDQVDILHPYGIIQKALEVVRDEQQGDDRKNAG